jgi:hypothetical protein
MPIGNHAGTPLKHISGTYLRRFLAGHIGAGPKWAELRRSIEHELELRRIAARTWNDLGRKTP